MWTVREEAVDSPDALALLREYFAELTVRYFKRETTEEEVDLTLEEFPSTGLAAFFVLRSDGQPAGCLGLHPDGELTRVFVIPEFRRGGGGRALLAAAEASARTRASPASSSTPATTSSKPEPSTPPPASPKSPRSAPQAPSRTTGSKKPSPPLGGLTPRRCGSERVNGGLTPLRVGGEVVAGGLGGAWRGSCVRKS